MVYCLSLLFTLLTTITPLTRADYAIAQQARNEEAVFYYNKGVGYFTEGKYQEALEAFKQSLRLDPKFMGSRFLLGDTYSALGQFDEALTVYNELIRDYPKLPPPYYNRSYTHLMIGNGSSAAADAQAVLSMIGWRNDRSQYMVIVQHFGYRRAGSATDAARALDDAAAKSDDKKWPYPVIRYLRHEITADDLLKSATDNQKMTEARAYLGLDLLLSGHAKEALEQFQWVQTNGRKTYLEYRLSLAELKRAGNGGVKSK
ncbi:MAG: tetratricopeptide repeat protein [Pyrinomonadaceae bacterium]